MSLSTIRVLLVEDNATDALLATEALAGVNDVVFEVVRLDRLRDAMDCLSRQRFDAVLLDLSLPDSEGLETFTKINAVARGVPVVVLSHRRDEHVALAAVHAGAQDFLVKGQSDGLLARAVRHAIERSSTEVALRRSEASLHAAQRIAQVGSWTIRFDPYSVELSHEMYRMFGIPEDHPRDDLFGAVRNAIHPGDRSSFDAAAHSVVQSGKPVPLQHRVVWPDGTVRFISGETAEPCFDLVGKVTEINGVVRDITRHKEAEDKLRLAASVFTHAREGIFITDADGRVLEINETFTQITGYSREEVLGQRPQTLLNSGRHDADFFSAQQRALYATGFWSGEVCNRRKSGEIFIEILTVSVVRNEAGDILNTVALFSDITQIREQQRQLEHVAHYDALTGLPNRVLLADRLQQAIAQSQRRGHSLAVAYLDLDGFKAVNDRHGHDVGDQLLIALAQRMKTAMRDGDTLARIGGDEFVAVLVDLEQMLDFEPVLERLLLAVAGKIQVRGIDLQVSASIGVTVYPRDNADADRLLRHADQAMYLAKQAGRNRYHLFDVVHDAAVQIHRESLEHIRRALEQREFELFYQPKVNMKTGAVVGAEALVRWRHPQRGLLLPEAFLPVIEDSAVIVQMGEWVIFQALTQMVQWKTQGLLLPLSVNVSARQLQQGNFVERLAELLGQFPDVDPRTLELEILETSALEDVAQVSEVMRACQKLGVRFVLDDFGTGYSSLTYLKRLPAEVLKIDQSFVLNMLSDADDLTIVKGIIGLATAFRRTVVAEGVETVAHGLALLPLGCELAQGFGIACPMPAADLPRWLATWQPDVAWRNA